MKEKRSFSSLLIEKAYLLSGIKDKYKSKEKAKREIVKAFKKNAKPYKFPNLIRLKSSIVKEVIDGMDYYVFNKNEDSQNIILYVHGGAYVSQPVYFHWKFIEQLAINSKYKIYVPIYPKAPNYTYLECYEKMYKLYMKIIENDKIERKINIAFIGDSAGGGFILAFAQYLRNKHINHNANNIIMISPWLDMSLENPAIKEVDAVDPSLSRIGILESGRTWAGGESFDNYMLSPINGSFNDLGKITLFTGTHEILLPDARKLKDILTKENINFNYYEYAYMNHVFPLYPIIPEAKNARKIIYSILNDSKI